MKIGSSKQTLFAQGFALGSRLRLGLKASPWAGNCSAPEGPMPRALPWACLKAFLISWMTRSV